MGPHAAVEILHRARAVRSAGERARRPAGRALPRPQHLRGPRPRARPGGRGDPPARDARARRRSPVGRATAHMSATQHAVSLGGWRGTEAPAFAAAEVAAMTRRVREPAFVVVDPATRRRGVAAGGTIVDADTPGAFGWCGGSARPCTRSGSATAASTRSTATGSPTSPGAMANGIATTRLVIAMARRRLPRLLRRGRPGRERVERRDRRARAARSVRRAHRGAATSSTRPNEPALEEAVAELYIARGVRRVEASAYMALTPAIVRYAYHRPARRRPGVVQRPQHVFAKVSRPEVARQFLAPAPAGDARQPGRQRAC